MDGQVAGVLATTGLIVWLMGLLVFMIVMQSEVVYDLYLGRRGWEKRIREEEVTRERVKRFFLATFWPLWTLWLGGRALARTGAALRRWASWECRGLLAARRRRKKEEGR